MCVPVAKVWLPSMCPTLNQFEQSQRQFLPYITTYNQFHVNRPTHPPAIMAEAVQTFGKKKVIKIQLI